MYQTPPKPQCSVTTIKPNHVNVTPFALHQHTQPRYKGYNFDQHHPFDSLPILYGGGRDFLFGSSLNEQEQTTFYDSELFILDTCIIIWIKTYERGIQIPYQRVLYHAIADFFNPSTQDSSLKLIITIERDHVINDLFPPSLAAQPKVATQHEATFSISSIELIFKPRYANHDRHYNDQLDQLFTFRNFGLNRGNSMVLNCNRAIATCMEFYTLDEDEDEDEELDERPETTINDLQKNTTDSIKNVYSGLADLANDRNTYNNFGKADDLDNDSTIACLTADGTDAGMSIQFYSETIPINGMKRYRE